VAVLVDGKGFFNEHHPGFVGTYFKALTDPMSLRELVDASDALLCVGEWVWGCGSRRLKGWRYACGTISLVVPLLSGS
jgi:TPP-dependent 2-oxoacid decarboxylase